MQIFFKKRHAYDAAAGAKLGFGVKWPFAFTPVPGTSFGNVTYTTFSVMTLHYRRLYQISSVGSRNLEHIKQPCSVKATFTGYQPTLKLKIKSVYSNDKKKCEYWINLHIPWNTPKSTLSGVIELEPTYTIGCP